MAIVGTVALGLIWAFRSNPEVWAISLIGMIVLFSGKTRLRPIATARDLLDGKVYVQTAVLLGKDMSFELRRDMRIDQSTINGYYGIFEGIGKLRIGYTAFEASTPGETYRITFSRASQRAWSVEPAE